MEVWRKLFKLPFYNIFMTLFLKCMLRVRRLQECKVDKGEKLLEFLFAPQQSINTHKLRQ